MKVSLISPYEIGRQPFALAQPAAWLKTAGFEVECIDLSVESFDSSRILGSKVVAIHLAMHTGARLASQIIPKIKQIKSVQAICVYGLYAPVNEEYFRSLGCEYVFGGESEADIQSLCESIRQKSPTDHLKRLRPSLDKLSFVRPDRSLLPELDRYSRLVLADGTVKTVGFVEATRGCKHLCKHCPVVPVYEGRFRVIPVRVALDDIRQQAEAGAEHFSFGDPDFLNGPGHSRRIIEKFRAEFPNHTWDATIKVEHLVKYPDLLQFFADNGCLFITTAVESIEDEILQKLDKGHTASDFRKSLALLRKLGISMIPTFVPFTPWTTLKGYRDLLKEIVELGLVNSVAPVQLSIRLLLPRGSKLLQSADRDIWLNEFNPELLGFDWTHPDSSVDLLHKSVQQWIMDADSPSMTRNEAFMGVWKLVHQALDMPSPELEFSDGAAVPTMTENWYCCAEPTISQQIELSDQVASGVTEMCDEAA